MIQCGHRDNTSMYGPLFAERIHVVQASQIETCVFLLMV